MATTSILRNASRHTRAINQPQCPGGAQAITPSDADSYSEPVHIYVGVAGNVAAVPELAGAAGSAVVFKGMPAGGVLPVRVWAVKATSTTATDMVAVYD
jgi:hypothetical protein